MNININEEKKFITEDVSSSYESIIPGYFNNYFNNNYFDTKWEYLDLNDSNKIVLKISLDEFIAKFKELPKKEKVHHYLSKRSWLPENELIIDSKNIKLHFIDKNIVLDFELTEVEFLNEILNNLTIDFKRTSKDLKIKKRKNYISLTES